MFYLLTLSDGTNREIAIYAEPLYMVTNGFNEKEYVTEEVFYQKYPERDLLPHIQKTYKYYECEAGYFSTLDDVFDLYKRLNKEVVNLSLIKLSKTLT